MNAIFKLCLLVQCLNNPMVIHNSVHHLCGTAHKKIYLWSLRICCVHLSSCGKHGL